MAGKVVASVRHDLRDVLAAKIKEIHASTRPASKNLDQVVEAAAAAAAAAASSAAAAADASAQVAHNVEANNTPNYETAPPGAEEDVKAMLKKLSEQVLETSSRLEEIEKHERELSDELADKADKADKAEAPGSNATEDLAAKVETKKEGAAPSSVKVPGYMNANEATPYWTQESEASHALEKPVHPHNLQDAVMTAEDVAALSPEQVASILTRDRELLAEVTAWLNAWRKWCYVKHLETVQRQSDGFGLRHGCLEAPPRCSHREGFGCHHGESHDRQKGFEPHPLCPGSRCEETLRKSLVRRALWFRHKPFDCRGGKGSICQQVFTVFRRGQGDRSDRSDRRHQGSRCSCQG